VEKTAAGGLANVELPTEVYGSPSATIAEEDHTAGLQAQCRPGSTWVECPRWTWSGSLALLLLVSGTDDILLLDGATHELVEGPAMKSHQLLADLCT
jgi:hypothetical protein